MADNMEQDKEDPKDLVGKYLIIRVREKLGGGIDVFTGQVISLANNTPDAIQNIKDDFTENFRFNKQTMVVEEPVVGETMLICRINDVCRATINTCVQIEAV
jgi:hypothetical protein